jgi:hypothetical protein
MTSRPEPESEKVAAPFLPLTSARSPNREKGGCPLFIGTVLLVRQGLSTRKILEDESLQIR